MLFKQITLSIIIISGLFSNLWSAEKSAVKQVDTENKVSGERRLSISALTTTPGSNPILTIPAPELRQIVEGELGQEINTDLITAGLLSAFNFGVKTTQAGSTAVGLEVVKAELSKLKGKNESLDKTIEQITSKLDALSSQVAAYRSNGDKLGERIGITEADIKKLFEQIGELKGKQNPESSLMYIITQALAGNPKVLNTLAFIAFLGSISIDASNMILNKTPRVKQIFAVQLLRRLTGFSEKICKAILFVYGFHKSYVALMHIKTLKKQDLANKINLTTGAAVTIPPTMLALAYLMKKENITEYLKNALDYLKSVKVKAPSLTLFDMPSFQL